MASLRTFVLFFAIAGGACASRSGPVPSPKAVATVQPQSNAGACGARTPSETEGPFYKAGPPEKTDFVEPGMAGTRLSLSGFVRDTKCAPLRDARVDFWQADAGGGYDNTGYRLRGYQYTDGDGRYHLETVVPGEYPGRTVHIHVKVTPPGGTALTTQLFMPGARGNDSDSIFHPALLMKVQDAGAAKRARFDFVVPR